MALVSLITSKQSFVRAFFDRELGEAKPVCKAANAALRGGRCGGPPVAPIPGADPGLVGLATEFIFAAVSGKVRPPHIAGAPTPDVAYQRNSAGRMVLAELDRLTRGRQLAGNALERAADCALVCARLEQRFRMPSDYAAKIRHPDPGEGEHDGLDGVVRATRASDETRADLVALIAATLEDTADVYRAGEVHIDPSFALSRALGGADADLIADGVLLDFKSSKDRSVIRSVDIYQLVGYTLADLQDWCGIHTVGIQALRWRTRWTISVAGLLRELSGTTRPLEEWRGRFARVFPDSARAAAMQVKRPRHAFTRDGAVILTPPADGSA